VSSVAVLEGSPFFANEFPSLPVDLLLREKSLDLWNFIGRVVEGNNQVKITERLRMGSLVKEIATVVQEETIDLIVLELRKRFPFPDLATLKLFRMIRSLGCPVLLGPPIGKSSREPRRPLGLTQLAPEEIIA
jgi:hypothetical protein